MNFETRPYQQEAIADILAALNKGENALLQAPCAAGKSFILATVTKQLLEVVPGFRALIIVDRSILVTQLRDTIMQVCRIMPGLACSSVSGKKDLEQPVTIATRQTIINHLDNFQPVNLIIADEVHLLPLKQEGKPPADQYGKIIHHLIEYNPRTRILGVTATPFSLGSGYIYGEKNKPGLIPYFENLTHKITYKELLESGHLTPITGAVTTGKIDTSNVGMVAGEYNLGQLSTVAIQHVSTVVDAINEHATGRDHILILCVDIDHCEAVTESLNNAEIKSVPFHSKLSPVDSADAMGGFIGGRYRCIVSVSKLTIGADIPIADCLVFVRPTQSPSLYMQGVGRVMRLAPGKDDALLIDLTDNSQKHLRDFDLDRPIVKIPMPAGAGDAPFKWCPECEAQLHPKVVVCPECGFIFEKNQAEYLQELEKVELKSFTPADPEWKEVQGMAVELHESKAGKNLLKVVLVLGGGEIGYFNNKLSKVTDWICLPPDYSGYAVKKGEEKWEKYSSTPCPSDITEGLWVAQESFRQPTEVMVQENDRGYYELQDLKFEGELDELPF